MSVYDKDLLTGKDKVETAMSRIRQYCAGKRTLVAFSGGKDSQCCYHLCKMAGIVFSAQYSITRFEPPELIQFIRDQYPDVTFRRAYKRSLVDDIAENGLPNRWFRYCCDCKHKKTEGFDISVVGIRWAESSGRRLRWSSFGYKQDRTAYVCPVVDWINEDVWEYLNEINAPHCCLYDEGFSRIGCVCCPLSPSNMRRDAKRWPKIANALFEGHKKNWNKAVCAGGVTKRGKAYKMLKHGSAEASFEYWLDHGQTIPIADNKEDEPCLFAGTGFSESDGIENQIEE